MDPDKGVELLMHVLQRLTTQVMRSRDDSAYYQPPVCSPYGLEPGADQLGARMAQDSKV